MLVPVGQQAAGANHLGKWICACHVDRREKQFGMARIRLTHERVKDEVGISTFAALDT